MSWSKALLRNSMLALALVSATALTACSGFTPVYGERGIGVEKHAFRYDKPATRLDQIIYQDDVLSKLDRYLSHCRAQGIAPKDLRY